MAQVFEMIMLICFGLSWPFNITKSVRSRTAKGKSLWFEVCIIVGYLCGLAGKFISGNVTYVAAFYIGYHHGHHRPGADHPEQASGPCGGKGGDGMKFVLATHNPGKLKEMADILSGLGVEVVSPADVGISVDVEETGTTFAENAMLKAKAICAASGLPAIADDSGLCVDALNGGPGVYSARYGGEELDDRGRYTLLLQNMRGQTTRAAHFACAIACAFPGGDELTAEGRCDGAIAFAPMGTAGFGYDPVFLVPEKGRTFGQLTAEEKGAISHRGKALRAFSEKLATYLKK